MLKVLPSNQRGRSRIGWLDSYHTFSFADFYDPNQMGFRALRVINEDYVEPANGFDTHPHRDMEIITVVTEGALEHKDSMGNGSVIRPGDVQRMSAGTGVLHSERNPSRSERVHLFQIWILPERRGTPPSYEQKNFPADGRQGHFQLVASRDGRDGSITVHQDVSLSMGQFKAGDHVTYDLAPGRHAWLQVARGILTVNGTTIRAGDGLAVSTEKSLDVKVDDDAEALLFDLA